MGCGVQYMYVCMYVVQSPMTTEVLFIQFYLPMSLIYTGSCGQQLTNWMTIVIIIFFIIIILCIIYNIYNIYILYTCMYIYIIYLWPHLFFFKNIIKNKNIPTQHINFVFVFQRYLCFNTFNDDLM